MTTVAQAPTTDRATTPAPSWVPGAAWGLGHVAVARGAAGDPQALLRGAVRALERLGRKYGPYPWPSYAIVVAPRSSGP